jgi:lipopolysaccharide assembly outer membrane protein LptD (OstA)
MLGVYVARPPETAIVQAPPEPQEPPGVTIARPVLSYTRGDKTAWQAKLRQLEVRAGGQAIAAGPLDEALIFAKDGRPVIRVTAASIKGAASSRDFTVEGPVQAVAERGAIVNSPRVQWDDKDAKLHCFGPVTARFRSALMSGPEADYMVEQDTVVVPGEVRLTVGSNLIIGQQLTYNVTTDSFQLSRVRAVLHAKEARQQIQTLGH